MPQRFGRLRSARPFRSGRTWQSRSLYIPPTFSDSSKRLFSRGSDGDIAKLYVDKGDLVKANQLISRGRSHRLRPCREPREGQSGRCAGRMYFAAGRYVRTSKLQARSHAGADQESIRLTTGLDNAQIGQDMARGAARIVARAVKQVEVALQQAETNLSYSYIRAPVRRLHCRAQSRRRGLCQRLRRAATRPCRAAFSICTKSIPSAR